MTTYEFKIISLDVWGNREDGWEVNDSFDTGDRVSLTDTMTDKEIILAVANVRGETVIPSLYEIDGQGDFSLLSIDRKNDGKPRLQLRMTDESIAGYYADVANA